MARSGRENERAPAVVLKTWVMLRVVLRGGLILDKGVEEARGDWEMSGFIGHEEGL